MGADLDWEYPGQAGATNVSLFLDMRACASLTRLPSLGHQDFDKNDLDNFLTFLKALRAKLGKDKIISADTSAGVWVGSDGQPSKDLSGVRPSQPLSLAFIGG